MDESSNSGDSAEWNVFAHQTQEGRPVIVRSRVAEPNVREFAAANFIARVRCVLPRDQVNEAGMPLSTAALDEWEDKLLSALEDASARTYEIAVVTGAGARDFFFAAIEGGELLAAINAVEGDYPFELQLSRIDGPRDGLLNSLSPPA